MKKILILNLLFFILIGCGFTPMYSVNKKVDFYIENISFNEGDRELASFIKSNLNNYLEVNQGRKFQISALINYNKNSISKDASGNTEEYELSSELTFTILSGELKKSLLIKEKVKMKNFDDEFSELEYERSLKKNMARSISARLIMQISLINAN